MTIDFNSMSGQGNEDSQFEIERLSTPSSVNHGNQTWRTKWLWYWKNPKEEWIKFGDLDNYEGCKAGIKSAELEEAFVADPTGETNFKTTGTHSFDYIVNFHDMIQRNSKYGTTRELCRRPEFTNKLDFELNRLRILPNADNAMSNGIQAPANWSIPKWKDLSEHIVIVTGSIFLGVSHFKVLVTSHLVITTV
ncbi:zinc finger CCCH-type antiviral protein 1-like [Ruditapes philippinarum]|uniref:zinc finger CCCH-type antiviral protein 1-like n=1 Tax=Ruditapes philippinarum TaxID=129788 RepID=UPI00295AD387|nr:zinc finger CCCH-type antiviral protein 1-like [Ruditapes philippinarum]